MMERESVIEWIEQHRVIVIVRGVASDKLVPLAEALCEGGIRAMEFTYNACGDPSDETVAENIRRATEAMAGKMLVGAGTVLTEKQVELTAAAGGCFVISPDVNETVIRKTRALGLVSIPGALTPSEITQANRAGADFIKLFPADLFGPKYVKTLSAPLSHVRFLAVGGVNDQTIPAYLAAGVKGFGVASAVLDREAIAKGDFDRITALTRSFLKSFPQ